MIVFAPTTLEELKTEIQNRRNSSYGPINTWNVSNIISMKGLFENDEEFNEDISAWDVSNVTDMSYMFKNAKNFKCVPLPRRTRRRCASIIHRTITVIHFNCAVVPTSFTTQQAFS